LVNTKQAHAQRAEFNVRAAETIPLHDKATCMEGPMAEFGRYIGNWDIADSIPAGIGNWKSLKMMG